VFGVPAQRARPVLRVTAHVRSATSRRIGAAIGSYHDGENALADQPEDGFGRACSTSPTAASSPCAAGSGSPVPALTWPGGSRTAKSVPFKTTRTVPDGF